MDVMLIFGVGFLIVTWIVFIVVIEYDRKNFEKELKEEFKEEYDLTEEELDRIFCPHFEE